VFVELFSVERIGFRFVFACDQDLGDPHNVRS
jgi:hypothetical protein